LRKKSLGTTAPVYLILFKENPYAQSPTPRYCKKWRPIVQASGFKAD
jgi:hypothetical protein